MDDRDGDVWLEVFESADKSDAVGEGAEVTDIKVISTGFCWILRGKIPGDNGRERGEWGAHLALNLAGVLIEDVFVVL